MADVKHLIKRSLQAHAKRFADGGMTDADEAAMMPETFVNPAVKSAMGYAAAIPKRAFESSEAMRRGEGYDPGPVLEAATLPMGTGAIAGLPVRAGEVALGAGPIRAYHGSPYDFDRFDISKVGSGEGAQSYGHGLYFAEHEPVALAYRNSLGRQPRYITDAGTTSANSVWDEAALARELAHNAPDEVRYTVQHALGQIRRESLPLDAAIADMHANYPHFPPGAVEQAEAILRRANPRFEATGGKMYDVNLNADPAKMLDWDRPLDQQNVWDKLPANVRDSIDEAMDARGHNTMSDVPEAYTGRELYRALQHEDVHEALPPVIDNSDWYKGNTTEARHTSAFLNSLDVPGIKYLDQRSRIDGDAARIIANYGGLKKALEVAEQRLRSAGTGDLRYWDNIVNQLKKSQTSNYVMFNDRLINIMKKYARGGIAPRNFADGGDVGGGVAPRHFADGGDAAADEAAMMPETFANPLVKRALDPVLPRPGFTERYPFLPRLEDFQQALRDSDRTSAEMQESGVQGMRSGDPVKMGLGAAQSAVAPFMPLLSPFGAAYETAKKAAGRIGPGLEQAADVASWANPETLLAGVGKFAPAMAAVAPTLRAAARGEEAAAAARTAQEGAAADTRRGLTFPEEESADRLRLKLQRQEKAEAKGTEPPGQPANERTVIKAPKGSGLPDFVAGNVTPEDWIKRQEKLLSPDEIHKAAGWYDEVFDHFLQQAHGDQQKARRYMRGWLVAQQNVDVSGAMQNVLLQREQILRGVPEESMKAAGMPNPTIAARRVMQGRPIEGGVGQKIADFVDSAEGSDVRGWMGHHPSGGEPFVVDVHTARDTGMVDQELINHLTRLGYNKKQLADLKTDLGTSPTATQYENRADFGRELTQYLNNKKWMGRDDWKPREVQAIGWMGMTRLTANKADDVATGISNNMRHLSMELSPGEGSPWATKYGDRFSSLPPDQQYAVTHQMTQSAIQRASELAGVDVRDIVHGTGGWMNYQNPSTVAQAFASKQGADIAANALGHMLQQTEVWSNKVKPLTTNPKGFAVDFLAEGNHNLNTDVGLRDFWAKIQAADPTGKLFQGYQPITAPDGRAGIRALIDRGGAKTKSDLEKAVAGPIDKVIGSMPSGMTVRSQLREAEITKARNDWTKEKNGEAYSRRLGDLLGRDPAADLHHHGSELEEEFRRAIEAAEKGASSEKGGGLTSRALGGRVGYAAGGATDLGSFAQFVPPKTDSTPDLGSFAQFVPKTMSAEDVASGAIENAPASAMQFLKDTARAVMHPVDTLGGIKDLGLGLLEKSGAVGTIFPGTGGNNDTHIKYADAMGQYLKQRYGGWENVKQSFAQDPVGVLSDASMVLTGGGSAAARLPGAMGKVGEVVGTLGRVTDPLMAPVNAAKLGTKAVGELMTHTGEGSLNTAYRTGVEGGEAGDTFRAHMRGTAPPDEPVTIARQGLEGYRQSRAQAYRQGMGDINSVDRQMNPFDRVLDFGKIEDAVDKAKSIQTFKGQVLDKGANAVRNEMTAEIEHWKSLPPGDYHTIEGLDALKRSLGHTMMDTAPGTAARKAAGDIYNAVRNTIVDYDPKYATVMKQYEQASQQIKELEKSLSLGEKSLPDTALRKLQSILRNNANTNYGRRLELGKLLEEHGATHLMAALSGQSLNTLAPRGLGKVVAGSTLPAIGAGLASGHILPAIGAAAALPLMSPRLMGEVAHGAGRTVGRAAEASNRVLRNVGLGGNRTAGNAAYRIGRATNPLENADNPYAP